VGFDEDCFRVEKWVKNNVVFSIGDKLPANRLGPKNVHGKVMIFLIPFAVLQLDSGEAR
jgi:hypothetical protein